MPGFDYDDADPTAPSSPSPIVQTVIELVRVVFSTDLDEPEEAPA